MVPLKWPGVLPHLLKMTRLFFVFASSSSRTSGLLLLLPPRVVALSDSSDDSDDSDSSEDMVTPAEPMKLVCTAQGETLRKPKTNFETSSAVVQQERSYRSLKPDP
jgi:hypothetical protein